MKTIRSRIGKYVLSMLVVMICAISVTSIVYASSYEFNAEMRYRYINGKDNKVTYTIGKNKKIAIAGTVECFQYNKVDHEGVRGGALCAPQPTYIYLCESGFLGIRKTICGTKVTVTLDDNGKKFACSGKSTTSSKKYMYIYKPLNDGYDIVLSGTISY